MIFGLLYSVFGFLLDPKVLAVILHKEKYEMYQVNVLICWISPLNQQYTENITWVMTHCFRKSRIPTCFFWVF